MMMLPTATSKPQRLLQLVVVLLVFVVQEAATQFTSSLPNNDNDNDNVAVVVIEGGQRQQERELRLKKKNFKRNKRTKKKVKKGKSRPTATPETDSPAPTATPETDAPDTNTTDTNTTDTNTTRHLIESHGVYLNWDVMVEETAQITIDASAYAYAQDENPCMHVDAMLVDNAANRKMCKDFLELPLSEPKTCETPKIPKTVYSISADDDVSLTQKGLRAVNPEYEFRHFGDVSAEAFVRENCGDVVADAYSCLAPAAYRADLFRFCALHSQGGVYLDADILPLVALEELYDPCAVASVGHDFPQGRSQKQMKILAGEAGAPVLRCMLDKIVDNVRSHFYPDNALALTGPMVLEDCYTAHPENISITYRDTRNAAYPYSGMSADDALLAFEVPVAHRDYQEDLLDHKVYRTTCPLHRASHVKAVADNSM